MRDDGLNGKCFAPEFDLAAADAGNIEQVVDQTHHMAELPLHHVAGPAGAGGVVQVNVEQVQPGRHCRQRVAQFMRQGREKFILAPVFVE